MATLAENKKAKHDYQLLDTWEAGIMLTGQEAKSVRSGGMKLQGSFVKLHDGGAWLVNAGIVRFPKAGALQDYDPERSRKLLLRTRELKKIMGKLEQKGLTLVPISAYTKGSRIKISFALAKGKKEYEKRETLKKRDLDRDLRRSLRGR
jgi:SsrA-binding protein